MTTSISGTTGITYPAGGSANTAGAGVGTTDSQTLTNKTLTSPTITGAVMSSMASSVITSGTAVASTSGTSITFTSIPSWVKRITVMFNGVSTSGTSSILIQVGAGSVTTTGYASSGTRFGASTGATSNYTTGFGIFQAAAADVIGGSIQINNVTGNVWTASGITSAINSTANMMTSGYVSLSGTLDRVVITTVNGTDTFDAGSINIFYE